MRIFCAWHFHVKLHLLYLMSIIYGAFACMSLPSIDLAELFPVVFTFHRKHETLNVRLYTTILSLFF